MIADILTKLLSKGRFELLCDKIGLEKVNISPPDELRGSVGISN